MRATVLLCLLLCPLQAVTAAPIDATPANWAEVVRGLAKSPSADTEVRFQSGIYPVSAALEFTPAGGQVVLRAADRATPVLLGASSDSPLIRIEGAASVRIEGLHFRHAGVAVILRNDAGVQVENNWFDDVDGALLGVGLTGARVAHNRIDQTAGTPIFLQGGAGAVVSDNLIFDYLREKAGGAAVALDTERAPTVSGNLIRDQFGPGAAIWARRTFGARVTGNVVLNVYSYDWRAEGGGSATVTGNHFPSGAPAGNSLVTFQEQVPAVLSAAGLDRAHRGLVRAAPDPTIPGACSRVVASAGDRSALVTWHPPRFDGGKPVNAYLISASTGQSLTISDAHFRSEGYARLDQIPNGKPCTFTITAFSPLGHGKASAPSVAVVPKLIRPTVPGAPRLLGVQRDGGMACLRFAAPLADGGATITSYVLTVLPAKNRVVFTGRQILRLRAGDICFGVIDELGQGEQYGFTLTAANSAGESRAASLSP
ncbi:MAG TPA: right-handed parallel beta-helix repeat-containing protein [Opitutaceae bacterium]